MNLSKSLKLNCKSLKFRIFFKMEKLKWLLNQLIYNTFIETTKASRTKDSKGVVVLTNPFVWWTTPKSFFQIFQTSNHIFRKKFGGVRKNLYLCRSKTSKDTTNMNALLWILVIVLALWEDRSVLFWLLVAWITKPVVVIILLLLIGKSE